MAIFLICTIIYGHVYSLLHLKCQLNNKYSLLHLKMPTEQQLFDKLYMFIKNKLYIIIKYNIKDVQNLNCAIEAHNFLKNIHQIAWIWFQKYKIFFGGGSGGGGSWGKLSIWRQAYNLTIIEKRLFSLVHGFWPYVTYHISYIHCNSNLLIAHWMFFSVHLPQPPLPKLFYKMNGITCICEESSVSYICSS